jgi:hypothetical protein
MIFVSYSHNDKRWKERFETISKPLSRSEKIEFWSDENLKAAEWDPQIEQTMKRAEAAVLLVSDNFLAADYIIQKELPYLLQARRERNLMIFWAYLEPCDLKWHSEITKFSARKTDGLKPMSKMTDWEWKETMVRGCGMIDEFLKDLECPALNPAVHGESFPRVANVPLLAKPSRRDIEVLVYAGKKWWHQPVVKTGATIAKIHLGMNSTTKGTKFTVIAMTTERPLSKHTYPNLPDHRTISKEIILVRA